MERIFYAGECHSNLDPVPCINIHYPAAGAELNTNTITVRGQVLPKSVAFQHGMLIVDSVSYPVTIDADNEFSVPGVALRNGMNTISMMVDPAGSFSSGSSLPTEVERISSPSNTQATAGTILDDDDNPRGNVIVQILVDGVLEAETETDGCGYYNASGLPLGTITIEIEE